MSTASKKNRRRRRADRRVLGAYQLGYAQARRESAELIEPKEGYVLIGERPKSPRFVVRAMSGSAIDYALGDRYRTVYATFEAIRYRHDLHGFGVSVEWFGWKFVEAHEGT
jgi:hypothetical protein